MMSKPELGQRVQAQAILKRKKQWQNGKKITWERYEEPVCGIYTGVRRLNEGRVEQETDDYGGWYSYFVHENTVTAYQIVFSEHRNPALILPEDLIESQNQ